MSCHSHPPHLDRCNCCRRISAAVSKLRRRCAGLQGPGWPEAFRGSSLVQCEVRDFGEYALPIGQARLVGLQHQDSRTTRARSISTASLSYNIYFRTQGPVFGRGRAQLRTRSRATRVSKSSIPPRPANSASTRAASSSTWARESSCSATDGSLALSLGRKETKAAARPTSHSTSSNTAAACTRSSKARSARSWCAWTRSSSASLEDRMTVVSASEMQKSIDETGRVTLYGILFDFNKSETRSPNRVPPSMRSPSI